MRFAIALYPPALEGAKRGKDFTMLIAIVLLKNILMRYLIFPRVVIFSVVYNRNFSLSVYLM